MWKVTTRFSQTNAFESVITEYDGDMLQTILTSKMGSSQIRIVETNSVPTMKFANGVPQIWLAYVAGDFLRESKTNLVPPLWSTESDLQKLTNFVVPIRHQFGRSDRFLESVTFVDPGFIPFISKGKVAQHAWPKPYDQGFRRAEFKVTEWTNAANALVPCRFIYHEYRPEKGGSHSNDLREVLTIKGSVYSHEEHARVSPTPFSGKVAIQDHRTPASVSGGVSYRLQGTNLPAAGSKNLQALIEKRLKSQELQALAMGSQKNNGRSVFWSLAGFLTIGFLFLLFRQHNKQHNRRPTP